MSFIMQSAIVLHRGLLRCFQITAHAKTTTYQTNVTPLKPVLKSYFSTLSAPGGSSRLSNIFNMFKSQTTVNPKETSLLQLQSPVIQPSRSRVKLTYRPNAMKRMKKHGLKTRLQTRGGRMMLWRRKLKGRHNLAIGPY